MMTRFLWNGMSRNVRLLVLLVLAIGVALPLLNQLMPRTSALYMPSYILPLIG
jgi:urea transport system permease protein